MQPASADRYGLVRVRSSLSFAKTAERLLLALKRRGMVRHAIIDHAENAASAGLELRPTKVFIFSYPEAEGPVIGRCPLMALDLPRRMAVWEDEGRVVWIAYDDPPWLGSRHSVNREVASLLRPMSVSLEGIALEAGGMASSAKPL